MTEALTLDAEVRSRVGTGGARACRRSGMVPGIVYGEGREPTAIAVAGNQLLRHLKQPGFFNHVFELDLAGRRERVLPRDLQVHPVSSLPLHVDFLRVGATSELSLDVGIVFLNEDRSPGLKKGGVLNVVEHAVEVLCRADRIPERIEVDLAGFEIGDVIHVENLPLPEGVRLAPGVAGSTIASITAPTAEAPTAAEAEGAEEEAAEKTA